MHWNLRLKKEPVLSLITRYIARLSLITEVVMVCNYALYSDGWGGYTSGVLFYW